MALSTKWTRAQLRTSVRRHITDTSIRWWTDAELNQYLQEWQDTIQGSLELVWGTATVTTALATLTLSNVDVHILRPEAIYWNGERLSGRDKQEMEALKRSWRQSDAATPKVAYQNDINTISFWPPPATTGTAVFEYPLYLDFETDTSTMQLPAWTRYSAKNFCAYKAFVRAGPNHDIGRAARYKAKFMRQAAKYRLMKDAFLPSKYMAIRPAAGYEATILRPNRVWVLESLGVLD